MKKTLSFIGCGNMASAIIKGAAGYDICIYDTDPSKYEPLKALGCFEARDTRQAVEMGDFIFLCVKPQVAPAVFETLSDCPLSGKVIVSIMAGITVASIEKALGEVAVIRTMPNTPLMLGSGVTALCRNERVNDKKFSDICRLFSEMGEVMVVKEEKMSAVTAASGSAPAYVYLFIKAIADEARAMGLDQKELDSVIARMVIGSCRMVIESGSSPEELIRMVCSPNGTTERAMKVFEDEGFASLIGRAMQACEQRATELSGQ